MKKNIIKKLFLTISSSLLLGTSLSLVTCSNNQNTPSYYVNLEHDKNCDFFHPNENCFLQQEYQISIKFNNGYELASLSIIVNLPDKTSKELLENNDYQISEISGSSDQTVLLLRIFADSVVGDINIDVTSKKSNISIKITNDNEFCQLFYPNDPKQEVNPISEIKSGLEYQLGIKCIQNAKISSLKVLMNNIELKENDDYSYTHEIDPTDSTITTYYLKIYASNTIDDLQIIIQCDDKLSIKLTGDDNCWFVDEMNNPITNIVHSKLKNLALSIKYNEGYKLKQCLIVVGNDYYNYDKVKDYFSADNSILSLPTSFFPKSSDIKNISITLKSCVNDINIDDYYYAIDNNDNSTYCFDTNTIETDDTNTNITAIVYKNGQKQQEKKVWNRQLFNENIHIGKNIQYIGKNFLANCSIFDSNIIFDNEKEINSIKKIDDYFMYKCEKFTSFNKSVDQIIINRSIDIGSNFLAYTAFNCSIEFGTSNDDPNFSNGSNIDESFLSNCKQFNSNIYFLKGSIKTINTRYFMHNCDNMQASIKLADKAWNNIDTDRNNETAFSSDNKNALIYTNGFNIDYDDRTGTKNFIDKTFSNYIDLHGSRYYRRIICKHRYITISKNLSPDNKDNPSPSYYIGKPNVYTRFSYYPMYFDEQAISTDGKSKYISKHENDPTYKIIYPENGDFDYSSSAPVKRILIEKNTNQNIASPENVWPIYISETFNFAADDEIHSKNTDASQEGSNIIPQDKWYVYNFDDAWWFNDIKITWSKFNKTKEITNFTFTKSTRRPKKNDKNLPDTGPIFNWELILPSDINIFDGDILIERICK